MKKKVLLILLAVTSFSLVGCTGGEESFEDKVIRKFGYVDSAQKQLELTVAELVAQVDILKKEAGVPTKSKFTENDLKFSSVKVLTKSGESSQGEVRLPSNSKFNLSIDIMNTTEENLSQLICQAYVTYKVNGEVSDRYLLDTRFDVMPKNIRRAIEFRDIPVKGANVEHILTIIIKDVNGNAVNKFEKKIHVK